LLVIEIDGQLKDSTNFWADKTEAGSPRQELSKDNLGKRA